MIKKYIIFMALPLSAVTAVAQYDQDISVDGRYVPEFILHDRLAMFPQPANPGAGVSSLNYDTGGVVADFTPRAIPVIATGWNINPDWDSRRGYVDLGLGSWLTGTLSAGYRIIDTPVASFGVRLQHNSTSLWKPDLAPSVSRTHRSRYDDAIGIYGTRNFGDAGTLSASADWHLGYFNYYGFNPLPALTPQPGGTNINAPTQTLNNAAVTSDWHSPSRRSGLTYYAGLSYSYLGMRRLYLPDAATPMLSSSLTGGREHDASFHAGMRAFTATFSSVGFDLDSHLLAYSGYQDRGLTSHEDDFGTPSTYGSLSVTPWYRYANDNLSITTGARIDLAFNARDIYGNRYRTFNIAPDVRIDYAGGPVAIFLHATGGNSLNTLAGSHRTDYYGTPAILSTLPSYSPLDAEAGVTLGPFSGFHAGLTLAYRITRNQMIYGWYQTFLNGDSSPSDFSLQESRYDISGFSIGLAAGYDAGRYFRIDARGTYQPQNGESGYFNGFDRARWTASATASTNPWSTLKFRIGFDFRAVRGIPYILTGEPAESLETETSVRLYRLPHFVSLNLGASYDITRDFGVWIQADNITARRNMLAPSLPEAGPTVCAGLSFLF